MGRRKAGLIGISPRPCTAESISKWRAQVYDPKLAILARYCADWMAGQRRSDCRLLRRAKSARARTIGFWCLTAAGKNACELDEPWIVHIGQRQLMTPR